jgi:fructose-1,6-bisphosphatase I
MASSGHARILDITPGGIHQRTPFIVGSCREMEAFAARQVPERQDAL